MFPDTVTDLIAWGFGLLGMTCLAIWPLFRTQAAMLSIQLGVVGGLSLHYALLGFATAAVVNALGVLQIVLTLLSAHRPNLRWTGYAVAIAMVATGVFTWQGVLSFLSATGMALVAIGRMQRNAGTMRAVVLAGGPFWLLHDILIASPVAIADAVSLVVGLAQLAHERLAHTRGVRVRANGDPVGEQGVDLFPQAS
jgi:Bacterial inner membrane protein